MTSLPPISTPSEPLAEQKANFLATISHELRTPMQSIYALLELIEQENRDPSIQNMVRSAQGSANMMLDLLNDILDFARLDAGRFELEHLEIPLRTLVSGVVEALSPRLMGKPVTIQTDIDDDVPTLIIGDPTRLRQVLVNLVSNAIKFTEKGNIRVRIFLISAPFPDQHLLRFEVIDTGKGIPSDVQTKLFKPFVQGDATTARRFGGTGLGLSICHRLVTLMGGEIGVISALDNGSTFWFEIPFKSALYPYTDTPPDLTGLSIIAVDHHPLSAAEIERTLKQMGANITVTSRLDALTHMLGEQRFDLAIMDGGQPIQETLDHIKKFCLRYPRMAIIVYTFHEAEGLKPQLDQYGATYLPKPASRQGLGQAVLDVTKNKWKQRPPLPKRILIVEDTDSIRETLRLQMNRLGILSDFAVSGSDAIHHLRENHYGLILMDLHMPDMDGYELIKHIRNPGTARHDVPVILLTADVQMGGKAAYSAHGFDDCLIKPATFQHLKHMLERWGIPIQSQDENVLIQIESVARADHDDNLLINLIQLRENTELDNEHLGRLLSSFGNMCTPIMDEIIASTKKGDIAKIAECAHSLKGAASFACAHPLMKKSGMVQKMAESGKVTDDVVNELSDLFKSTIDFINRTIDTL